MTRSPFSKADGSGFPRFIGVVHLPALPGAPRFGGSMEEVLSAARRDARALANGGVDALIVENFGDAPFYRGSVPAETVAAMACAVSAVREESGELPVGVNVLRNDARAAVALCAATGAAFLRVNVLVGAMVTDQGIIEGEAAAVQRDRQRLAPAATLLADVDVKHARPLGNPGDDGRLEALVRSALDTVERGLADALILSGSRTGAPPAADELQALREALPATPLVIGSGATPERARTWGSSFDAAIVGTWLKEEGDVKRPVDADRVARMREALGN